MSRYLKILGESGVEIEAELNDCGTARAVWDLLPAQGMAGTWGNEFHLRVPLEAGPDSDAREELEVGDVAFLPEDGSLGVFYGPTPASKADDKPRPASAANVVGKLTSGLEHCWSIGAGDPLRAEGVER